MTEPTVRTPEGDRTALDRGMGTLTQLPSMWRLLGSSAYTVECAARAGEQPASFDEVEDDAMSTIYAECAQALTAILNDTRGDGGTT